MIRKRAIPNDGDGGAGRTGGDGREQGAPPTPDNTPSIYRLFNDGEDFTRPVQRLDLRERYENLPSVKKFDPEKWQT